MRIGIDARFLTHPQPGGFKTYTENLVSALARIDSENEYVLYLDRLPMPQDRIPRQENFQIRIVPAATPLIGLPWREQIALARQAKMDQVDVFHAPCLTAPLNLSCPLMITVHDMIWASPENFTSNQSWSIKRRLIDWYNFFIPKYAIRKASVIVTVSQASKESIIEILEVSPEKIIVTYEAAGAEFRRIEERATLDAVCGKYNLPLRFILALGAADPRKNIKGLIKAYASLSAMLRQSYKLVIVWTHPFLAHEVNKLVEGLGLVQDVIFLQRVPNEELAIIYNLATLFVFPSRYEGFGLPLLEAMSCGAPVIAANNSSIPEVAGDAAVYFDAQDPLTMTEAIVRTLGDAAGRSALVRKGLARAGMFSWERCAHETFQIYRKTAGSDSEL